MKKRLKYVGGIAIVAFLGYAVWLQAQTAIGATPIYQTAQDFTAATFVAHSHVTATTLTINPGTGNYVYLTGLDISDCATGTAVGAAVPTYITTTGFAGILPQYQIGSGVTAGLCQPTIAPTFAKPLKSATPGAAVTFILPAFATNQVVSANFYYYVAP